MYKSMPQRRQEQTAEKGNGGGEERRGKEGRGELRRGGEGSTFKQWSTKTRHQEAGGQRDESVTLVQPAIVPALKLKLN